MPINESDNFAANKTSKRYDPIFQRNYVSFVSSYWEMILSPT